MKKNTSIITILALSAVLSACVPAAFVTGGAAGASITGDQRSFSTMTKDQSITQQIGTQINGNKALATQAHIVATAYQGNVLLMGQAPNESLREKAEAIAQNIKGVVKVYNEISIAEPTSGVVRSKDSWITTKAKSILLTTGGLRSNQLKVITENGTLFLIGSLPKDQIPLATNAARNIDGVQKVVTLVFAQIQQKAPAPTDAQIHTYSSTVGDDNTADSGSDFADNSNGGDKPANHATKTTNAKTTAKKAASTKTPTGTQHT